MSETTANALEPQYGCNVTISARLNGHESTTPGAGPMELKAALFAFLLLLAAAPARVTAAPFVNLDFEQATVPPGSGETIAASAAFPGWTPRIGNLALNNVYYNYPGIGEPCISLYDQPILGGMRVLQGQYSVLLVPSQGANLASLSQYGDVPADAKSFLIYGDQSRPAPVVTFDNTLLPLVIVVPSSSIRDPVVYGADVSSFAGRNVELRISSGASISAADNAHFSSSVVPEPTPSFPIAILVIFMWLRRSSAIRAIFPGLQSA